MAARYSANAADAEDQFQKVAVALWKALPTFRREFTMGTFVYSIARRRCVSFQTRERRRRKRLIPIATCDPGGTHGAVDLDRPVALERAHRRAILHAAIDSLPETQRAPLRMRLAERSDREIAARLGISEPSVAVRMFRARAQLRALLTSDTVADGTRLGSQEGM